MLLISACLIGEPVRYDGRSCSHIKLKQLFLNKKAHALCPELLGGFSTPRLPAEIVGGTGQDVLDGKAKILDSSGLDVTELYLKRRLPYFRHCTANTSNLCGFKRK
ncbi:2-thiouracil desulfurase family protein [Acinetobacter baumannii]|nr:2-thiouracil desulfurase family protein [Acinetobacter baumannii]MDO7497941.1 2-thiouracil desulfurase family protein [Acinetobacter baumannii]MDV7408964.1 2-thiouracil desulfurase family protein [Acinetobacter baumannii]